MAVTRDLVSSLRSQAGVTGAVNNRVFIEPDKKEMVALEKEAKEAKEAEKEVKVKK